MCGRYMPEYHSSGIYVLLTEPPKCDSLVLENVAGMEWTCDMDCVGTHCAKNVPPDFKLVFKTAR